MFYTQDANFLLGKGHKIMLLFDILASWPGSIANSKTLGVNKYQLIIVGIQISSKTVFHLS